MVATDVDGGTYYFEYAVTHNGHTFGPLARTAAERLATETGGTITRRQITHGPWHTLTEVNA